MKSKISMLVAIALSVMCTAMLLSCATPHSKPPTATAPEIEQEAIKQKALVVEDTMKMQFRLNEVSYTVLTGASSFCKRKKLISGYFFYSKEWATPEYKEIFTNYYNLKSLPKVLQVYHNSPCEKAGVKVGDEIVSINGKPLPNKADDLKDYLSPLEKTPILEIELLRDGSPLSLTIKQTVTCDYPVLLTDSGEVNAATDGEKIYVTKGLIRFMNDDSELATIISHELAHDVREHSSMKKKNSIAGMIGGMVLDIAVAFVGVNTQGQFTKLGGQIGSTAYSKDIEKEADYVGLYILAASGYEPKNAPNVFRRLGTANPKSIEGKYAASHPSTPERYVYLDKTVEEIKNKQCKGMVLIPEERNGTSYENTKLAQADNPMQNAVIDTSTKKPETIQHDNSAETTQQDTTVVNSQKIAEKPQAKTLTEISPTVSHQPQSIVPAVHPEKTSVESQPSTSTGITQKTTQQTQQATINVSSLRKDENMQLTSTKELSAKVNLAKAEPGLTIDLPKTFLVKGKTTKQDVDRDLGKPMEEERSISGEYLYCSYLCTITPPNAVHGSTYKVILKFDNKGILNDYRTKIIK